MWSSTAFAFAFMTMIAAIYEPCRLALNHHIPQNIGGVGGVGGLANMLGANDENCHYGHTNSTFHDNYCYEKGILGPFTPFAWFMLIFWVGPIVIAAVITTIRSSMTTQNNEINTINNTEENSVTAAAAPLGMMAAVWIGLNVLWFVVPLSVFWFGLMEMKEDPIATRILAVAIAASHPLSWNLMVAAIPASGITSKLLGDGIDRQTMFQCHRFVSYFTVFWGMLHGILELVYLTMTKSPDTGKRKIIVTLLLQGDGEDLLYIFGLVALLLIIAQGLVGFGRKILREKTNWSFRTIHRNLAFALLLAAAAHWSPFFIFLIPALSLHGAGIACYRLELLMVDDDDKNDDSNNSSNNNKSLCSLPSNSLSRAQVAILVTLSTLCSCLSTYGIWTLRERYMISSVANLSVPFAFPILCIAASLFSSSSVSTIYLLIITTTSSTRRETIIINEEDLLPDQGDLTISLLTARLDIGNGDNDEERSRII